MNKDVEQMIGNLRDERDELWKQFQSYSLTVRDVLADAERGLFTLAEIGPEIERRTENDWRGETHPEVKQ